MKEHPLVQILAQSSAKILWGKSGIFCAGMLYFKARLLHSPMG
jgi:hypothetical protein